MKIREILEIILGLSRSQGFYGRLLESLLSIKDNDPDQWDQTVKELEGQNFKSAVDVVLYFEQ